MRAQLRLGALLTLVAAALAATSCAGAQPQVPGDPGDSLRPAAGDLTLPDFVASPASDTISRQAQLDTVRPQRPSTEVVRYTVQPGDSVFGIAERFGLKPETVLWGNLDALNDDPHLLRPGMELNLLPVDGVYYQWQAGDDLDHVASEFGVAPDDILDWPGNQISPTTEQIADGQWLVIPGGQRPFQTWLVPTIARGQAGVGKVYGSGGCDQDISGGAIGTGGFIWPVSNRVISGNDFWSGHLAVDLAAGLGDPVWAADSGVVVFAGWSLGGYGQIVQLDHGNGWQTVYAHLSQIQVRCGQSVQQGEQIGLAGSTGNSTGPHLHFEVRYEGGFINPWFVLP